MNPRPINPDTPRKPSASRQHLDLDLEAARTAVVADLGDIPQVSVEFFIKSALPSVEPIDIHRVRKRLRQTKAGVIHRFPKAPKDAEGAEPVVFAPMKDLFDDIVTCLTSGSKQPRLKYMHSPGSTPGSERANSTRPDSHLELLIPKSCKGSTSASAWADIPLVLEQKKLKNASTILDVSISGYYLPSLDRYYHSIFHYSVSERPKGHMVWTAHVKQRSMSTLCFRHHDRKRTNETLAILSFPRDGL